LISSKVKFESWQSVKDWPENSFSGDVNVAGAHATLSLPLQVDVWSVGVIFYQMLFGKRPFGHNQCQEQLVREDTIINARRVEFPTRPSVSHEAKVSILLLLCPLVFSFCRSV
jgi:serine/threonine protein kinase